MPLIRFPQKQRAEMSRRFGEGFVTALPARLAGCARRWQLRGFALIEHYSVNCLLTCRSAMHGDCVLKLFGCGYDGYIHEVRALAEFRGARGYVRAYEADEQGGALLLERVRPGASLKAEPSPGKRLAAFVSAWQGAHKAPRDPSAYKTYLEVTRRAAASPWACEIPELRQAAQRAVAVCGALFERYPPRLLLHGDLHYGNLLQNAQGGIP